ncbi:MULTISPECIES: maleylpyruvate isomerase family mycothiol-dependent enzyme [Streptomyces]|uniref:maleylpyruvate isomerase family mycothiol-dependent enzyme n=1 Tax=Streptomyces TaxID=1883 RepID=UPI001E55B47F|nr:MULTISPECIES: maleylpyruvate isomerase family mycothiol-dependent enzyme [Streptomyces]UFQ16636.1 maleylpyruvate isomerase family mycothiol-dependent enzyme [Streptomyces huasconensis]WCL86237.1 maleylpyruvate isomerase family mycothiol-dependent enzyme [Streptomyces sp. JCM 35825]
MSTTALGTDERWQIIDHERADLARLLESLSPEEWERPRGVGEAHPVRGLAGAGTGGCGDWRVRDVAAHLTVAARSTYRWALREFVRPRGDVDRMIHDSAVREAERPVTEIVANLRAITGSRRLAPGTTPREALLDILVHGQDIALALGVEGRMPPRAAHDAVDRVWTMRFPPRPWPLPKARLVATDIDWTRGRGEEIHGPISALLLLLTGRTAAAEEHLDRAHPTGP